MKITKTPQKFIIAKGQAPENVSGADFFIAKVDDLRIKQQSLTEQGIFNFDPNCGILQNNGDFKVYTDNEEFEEITNFLESDEKWSYIHLKKKDFILLEEMYGYYEYFNSTIVFKGGFTLTGHFKHTSDEVWCEITAIL